ncbi:MAG: quinolinate synthase [Spirochaetes bacterium]|nr:MAG: quinolinate synthase [Spirochaetota bacterium]
MGFIDRNLADRIERVKERQKAVVLAHNFVNPEVHEIADFTGSSLQLCMKAIQTDADVIIVCGVRFMGENIKLLVPQKTVLLPERDAECPMADMVSGKELQTLKNKYPNALVLASIKTNAREKARSHLCYAETLRNDILRDIPPEREIIFLPDKYTGLRLSEVTARNIISYPGFCPVHMRILPEDIVEKKRKHPHAPVASHSHCSKAVTDLSDFTGDTEELLNFAFESGADEIIYATERDFGYRIKSLNPECNPIPASFLTVCTSMKRINAGSVLRSLESLSGVVELDSELANRASLPLSKILKVKAGKA